MKLEDIGWKEVFLANKPLSMNGVKYAPGDIVPEAGNSANLAVLLEQKILRGYPMPIEVIQKIEDLGSKSVEKATEKPPKRRGRPPKPKPVSAST